MSEISDAARAMGRVKSKAKAAAARRNGQLGGRPKKTQTDLQKTRAKWGHVKGKSADRRKARRAAK